MLYDMRTTYWSIYDLTIGCISLRMALMMYSIQNLGHPGSINTLTKKDEDGVKKLILTKRDMSPEFYSGDRLPNLTRMNYEG